MRATLSLFRREFTAYFLSPIGYVVLTVFLFVVGIFFNSTLELLSASGPRGIEFPMQVMLGDQVFWLVFLIIPPLLTMKLFAEERATGTLEMLMTAPLHDWQLVLSKFTACFAFYLVLWLPTLLYLFAILSAQSLDQRIDPRPVCSSYLGLILAGAMFLALGLFVSSLVRSQMVAALISLVLSLGFVLVGIWKTEIDTGSWYYRIIYFFSVPLHFHNDFCRGVVDSRHVVLYLSVTAFFLFMTVRSLESRRWK